MLQSGEHGTNSHSAESYNSGLAAFPPPDCKSSGSLCLGFIPAITDPDKDNFGGRGLTLARCSRLLPISADKAQQQGLWPSGHTMHIMKQQKKKQMNAYWSSAQLLQSYNPRCPAQGMVRSSVGILPYKSRQSPTDLPWDNFI